jgi:ABC-type nickel/cobalt efflux system permease component RcnA
MTPDQIAIVLVALLALVSFWRTFRRPKLSLEQAADIAYDAGEQLGATQEEKLEHSLHALGRLDMKDGHRDWSDPARRLAIEAVVRRRKVRISGVVGTR